MVAKKSKKIGAKMPVVFAYDNYRQYLKDLYGFLKKTKPAFSYRFFSRQAGFSSPNFLKLVTQGKRNLTPESMQRFAKAFKMKKDEQMFFTYMVQFNQAKTTEERHFFAREMLRNKDFQRAYPLAQNTFHYWSNWYNCAIYDMIAMPQFREDPDWIAKQLIPPITNTQAERSLVDLLALKLVSRDDDGKLVVNQKGIFSGDEVSSSTIKQFHREMIEKARESLDLFTSHDRQVSSVTIRLSKDGFEQYKELINEFRSKLVQLADAEQEPEGIFQLNFQLFPLTKKMPKGDKQ